MQIVDDIAVLILAAGGSSRMGTPKQLLSWKDTTLLGHVIETAKKSKAGDIFVVLGANYETILPVISNGEIAIFKNPEWQKGLGPSVAVGINGLERSAKRYDAVLMLLCDQPLISATYLEGMVQMFANNKKGIVGTKYGKKAGVPAIFGRKYFVELKHIGGDKGAREVIGRNSDDAIFLDAGGTEIDLDTPVEYQRFLKAMRR